MKNYEEAPEETALPEEGEMNNETSDLEGTPTPAPAEGAGTSAVESVDLSPVVSALELIRQDQADQYLIVDQLYKRDREIHYGLLALLALLMVYIVVRDFLKG